MALPDPALLLAALAAEPVGFFLAVVALSFLLEDATAVAAGALASQMRVDPALALGAVMVGTVAGDLLLHGAGRLAGRWPLLSRRVLAAGPLIGVGRSYALVAAARFVPGLRLPAYAGSGVARMPFAGFAAIVVLTGLLWTPLLFGAGSLASGPGAGLLFGALVGGLLLAPRLLRALLTWLAIR
jgi:membrane protein DedA with SNARE-associated domain